MHSSFQSSSYNDKSHSACAGLAFVIVRCSQPPTDRLCRWPYLDADYSEKVEQVRLSTWLL